MHQGQRRDEGVSSEGQAQDVVPAPERAVREHLCAQARAELEELAPRAGLELEVVSPGQGPGRVEQVEVRASLPHVELVVLRGEEAQVQRERAQAVKDLPLADVTRRNPRQRAQVRLPRRPREVVLSGPGEQVLVRMWPQVVHAHAHGLDGTPFGLHVLDARNEPCLGRVVAVHHARDKAHHVFDEREHARRRQRTGSRVGIGEAVRLAALRVVDAYELEAEVVQERDLLVLGEDDGGCGHRDEEEVGDEFEGRVTVCAPLLPRAHEQCILHGQ
mmetsp:Transcript_21449/g.67063  ORF Transcript_21449/g.67063 Transcript_21449/m.67063 type:complete len:274 (+) Transcript_21449:1895-2716(+)